MGCALLSLSRSLVNRDLESSPRLSSVCWRHRTLELSSCLLTRTTSGKNTLHRPKLHWIHRFIHPSTHPSPIHPSTCPCPWLRCRGEHSGNQKFFSSVTGDAISIAWLKTFASFSTLCALRLMSHLTGTN